MKRNKKSFLGTGWSFPPKFDYELDTLQMSSDEQDIRESLFILMSTTPGERPTNPDYGCDLMQFNFMPIDVTTEYLMRQAIKYAVRWFEPRVKLEEIDIDTASEIDGVIYLTLNYKIIKSNIRNNIVFPYYKVEGTEIREV